MVGILKEFEELTKCTTYIKEKKKESALEQRL
jgi:hypothetical protein